MKAFLTIIFSSVLIFMTGIQFVVGQDSLGTVTISYVLDRTKTIASNQFGIWIEDEGGRYIKTLFATRFAAEGGFRKRPQTLPEWVEKSGWENATQEEIDAVSGATPQSGTFTVVWDLTDRTVKPVPPGTYVYKIEGTIYWQNRVLWEGRIDVGGAEEKTSMADATYYPPEAAEGAVITTREGKQKNLDSVLIEQVKATYNPPR